MLVCAVVLAAEARKLEGRGGGGRRGGAGRPGRRAGRPRAGRDKLGEVEPIATGYLPAQDSYGAPGGEDYDTGAGRAGEPGEEPGNGLEDVVEGGLDGAGAEGGAEGGAESGEGEIPCPGLELEQCVASCPASPAAELYRACVTECGVRCGLE